MPRPTKKSLVTQEGIRSRQALSRCPVKLDLDGAASPAKHLTHDRVPH
jgi:hypothetical protein